jgi:hypothetical protein
LLGNVGGYIGFFNYSKGKLGNLGEEGGIYRDLHERLLRGMEREKVAAEKWEREHPRKVRGKRNSARTCEELPVFNNSLKDVR